MGRILFIRVSAVTFAEEDVAKAWPELCALVWPDADGQTARKAPAGGRGVLELADEFADSVRFGQGSKEWKAAMAAPLKRLEEARRRLDEALGDRDAKRAYAVTEEVEKALDAAEKVARLF